MRHAGRKPSCISGSLIRYRRKGYAFSFCLDHTRCLPVEEKQIIGITGFQRKFSHSHALTSIQV